MSMDGEILQRLRDHEDRLKRLEVKAGLLPPGPDSKTDPVCAYVNGRPLRVAPTGELVLDPPTSQRSG